LIHMVHMVSMYLYIALIHMVHMVSMSLYIAHVVRVSHHILH